MRKILILSIVLLIAIPAAYAVGGIGITPSRIEFEDLARGVEYEQSFNVLSGYEEEKTFELEIQGELKGWISFYDPDDMDKEIDSINVPSFSKSPVIMKLNVPETASNGNYLSELYVKITSEKKEKPQSVGFVIPTTIYVEITGEQKLNGEVKEIYGTDTETGQPFRVSVSFMNTGNVNAKPSIETKLYSEGIYIDEFVTDDTEVKAGKIDMIESDWDTTGRGVGNFTAEVKVYLDNKLLDEKNISFSIMKQGTFTAEGRILGVRDSKNIGLNKVLKTEIDFFNSGKIDFNARVSGEVYKDGELIETIKGEDSIVMVNQKVELLSYFKPEEYGEYEIRRWVSYAGHKSDIEPISFFLDEGMDSAMTQKSLPSKDDIASPIKGVVFLSVIVLILALIVIALGIYLKRK